MARRFIGPAIILFAALVAITPELIRGNSCGHDFDFHLVSWFDALNAWRHGILYPHWTPSANYGAGEPRFVFYSPLTWMMGAALGAFLPWTWVPIALTFLLLAGTGLATRALAREALSEDAATLAGCAALFSGYRSSPRTNAPPSPSLPADVDSARAPVRASQERPGEAESEHRVQPSQSQGSPSPLQAALAFESNRRRDGLLPACRRRAGAVWRSSVHGRSCYAPRRRARSAWDLSPSILSLPAWEQRWVDIHQATQDKGQTPENSWLFAVHNDPALAYHDVVLHTVSKIAILMIAIALCALLLCRLRSRLPGPRAGGFRSRSFP